MTLGGASDERTQAAVEKSSAETRSGQRSTPPDMRVRVVSWLSAGVILLGFCWLGFIVPSFTEIFRGFERHLPSLTKFSMAYGSFAFPIFGVLGATAIILAEGLGRRQRFQALLFAIFVAGLCILVRSLLISGVWMSALDQ